MSDNSFGPRLLSHFDFTLLFEHTIFHLVPGAIILFATPYYVHKILRALPIVRSGWLLPIKLALALALVAIRVSNVALWWEKSSNPDSTIGQAAAVVSLFTTVCLGIIIYASHSFFLQSVTFLGLFLTVTLPLDIVTTFSYYRRDGLGEIARLHIAVPVLKFGMLLLEEASKRSLIRADNLRASLGSEGVAGFWNKSLFVWLNPLLLFGFRHKITRDTLADIGPQLASERLYQDFRRRWDSITNKHAKYALVKACLWTMPWAFLYVILPRLLVISFTFAQPFLLQDVVNEVSAEAPDPNVRRSLIVATALVYCGIAVSRAWYAYIKNQLRVGIRAVLIAAVYHKSLRTGSEELAKAAVITLINTDMRGIDDLVDICYESCSQVLEIGLGIAILGEFVGSASVFTLIPTIFATVLSSFVARRTLLTRRIWNEHVQDRVASTSNILAQIKDIKMVGLATASAERIHEQHEAEVKVSMADRDCFVASMSLAAFADTVTPVLVIAGTLFWSRSSEPITTARFFTTLAVVTMVSKPLASFLELLPYWTAGFASLKRVQEFLAAPDWEDPRAFNCNMPLGRETSASDVVEMLSLTQRRTLSGIVFALEMLNVAVAIDGIGSLLQSISLDIPIGSLAMLFGAVGCGKSTILRTMIGEVKTSRGRITCASDSFAYCSQTPWLQSSTVRDNIVGQSVWNPTLYFRVIHLCALDVDLAQLPDGDQTMVGADGCNLSGGQKARVSLARALHLEAKTLILDDPFSALDMETATTVRLRLFGAGGILEDGLTTVIMTTSTKEHLVDATVLFSIDENGAVEKVPHVHLQASAPSVMPRNAARKSLPGVAKRAPEASSPPPAVRETVVNEDHGDDSWNAKSGDVSLYAYFLGPAGASRLSLCAVLLVIAAIGERMPQIFVRIWLDKDPNSRSYFIGYALFGMANPVLHVVAIASFYYLINTKAMNAVHWNLADTAFKATFDYLMEADANFMLNRFSLDTSTITQTLPLTILPTIWGGLSILIDIGVIASGASYASPIIPFFLTVVFFVQRFYLRSSRQLRVIELDNSKWLTRHLTETASGIELIRTFRWQEPFTLKFYDILDMTSKPIYYLYAIQQWLRSVLDLTTAACAVSMVSLATSFKNSSSASSIGLALLSLISFSEVTSLFVRYFASMEVSLGAVARIRTFVNKTPTERDGGAELSKQWPHAGKIELSGVDAFYKPQSDRAHIALANVSVTIQPGETLGLVGRTGSGKSSLLLTLLNLLEYKGTIKIDGREISTVPRDTLRKQITTITQAGLEFKASVRYNIDPFKFGSTDDAIAETLERVGLWDHVVERGGLGATMQAMRLSQGQKQLFQISRAILHQQTVGSRIVLMDEGTASMDEDTEERIAALVKEAFAGCTKILISHREAMLDQADAILRLDRGISCRVQDGIDAGQSAVSRPVL